MSLVEKKHHGPTVNLEAMRSSQYRLSFSRKQTCFSLKAPIQARRSLSSNVLRKSLSAFLTLRRIALHSPSNRGVSGLFRVRTLLGGNRSSTMEVRVLSYTMYVCMYVCVCV